MPGKLLRPQRVTRDDLKANPTTLYVFGDNMARRGMGGQAREMRGKPNAVGVPTKWAPTRDSRDYFTDNDYDTNGRIANVLKIAFDRLEAHLRSGHNVAIPADGLGTGLAELPTRAPRIHAYIEDRIRQLQEIADGQ